jgi:hypothetical protein
MPLILGANSASGGYTVKNSLRFNSGSTDYLNRTNGTPTGTTKYTFSTWLKISKLSSRGQFFRVINPSSTATYTYLETDGSNFFGFTDYNGTSSLAFSTTAVFRDVSAWYHLVLAVDTTQATSTNRWKFYVNGVEVTSFASTSYGTQNQTIMATSSGKDANIGGDPVGAGATRKFDGYMSDVFFIDGQALTPSSFGQTDPLTPSSGIWVPKAYTGTYGNNGFYLKFLNSASLGTDSSGNGNNFTTNGGIAATSQSTDTPTNNFCTLNPLAYSGSQMSQGNLYFSATGNWTTALSTINPSTGKWYAEFKITQTSSNGVYIGVTPSNIYWTTVSIRNLSNSGTWYGSDGQKYVDGTGTSYGATFTTGDIIGVALDKTNNTIVFYKNGSSQGSLNLTSSTNSGDVSLAEDLYPYPSTVQANFGSPNYSANSYTDGAGYGNFSYAVPSGYYALCSANLAKYG